MLCCVALRVSEFRVVMYMYVHCVPHTLCIDKIAHWHGAWKPGDENQGMEIWEWKPGNGNPGMETRS